MKIEELMIGDYVLFYGRNDVQKINSIKCCFEDCNFIGSDKSWICNPDKDDIRPIFITDKVLRKIGFKGNEMTIEGVGKNIHITYYNDGVLSIKEEFLDVNEYCEIETEYNTILIARNINYVHELQQALRLCKIDKEIVL